MKKLFFLLIILSALLVGCNIEKRMARKCAKAERKFALAQWKYGCNIPLLVDSVFIHSTTTIFRDTTIFVTIEGDTVKITIRAVEGKKSELKTKYAVSVCWVENDSLHHELRQIESNIPATIPGAIQITHDSIRVEVPVPYPVDRPVPMKLNWIQQLYFVTGKITWAIVVLYLLYRAIKLAIKLKWFKL